MQKINLPEHYNYIGLFLTLGCNLSCSYCINHVTGRARRRALLNGAQWVQFINRLHLRDDLPITLQGGEPSTHPHFFEILKGVREDIKIDILTNLQFDPRKLVAAVPPERLRRSSPYASIRVSYHPETMSLQSTLEKVTYLMDRGYSIGLYSVAHPDSVQAIEQAQEICKKKKVDFRIKEFLGEHENRLYGTYKYSGAVAAKQLKSCQCKTSELLISPDGKTHRCHHDLYNDLNPRSSILSDEFTIEDQFSPCHFYGNCNPCDVKVKNSRLQVFGHTSVEIKEISP